MNIYKQALKRLLEPSENIFALRAQENPTEEALLRHSKFGGDTNEDFAAAILNAQRLLSSTPFDDCDDEAEPVRLTHAQLLDHLQGQIGVGKRYRTQAEAAEAWHVGEIYLSYIFKSSASYLDIANILLSHAGFQAVTMYEPIEEAKEEG